MFSSLRVHINRFLTWIHRQVYIWICGPFAPLLASLRAICFLPCVLTPTLKVILQDRFKKTLPRKFTKTLQITAPLSLQTSLSFVNAPPNQSLEIFPRCDVDVITHSCHISRVFEAFFARVYRNDAGHRGQSTRYWLL